VEERRDCSLKDIGRYIWQNGLFGGVLLRLTEMIKVAKEGGDVTLKDGSARRDLQNVYRPPIVWVVVGDRGSGRVKRDYPRKRQGHVNT